MDGLNVIREVMNGVECIEMGQFCSGEGVMVLTVRGSGNVEQGVGFEDGQLFGKVCCRREVAEEL